MAAEERWVQLLRNVPAAAVDRASGARGRRSSASADGGIGPAGELVIISEISRRSCALQSSTGR